MAVKEKQEGFEETLAKLENIVEALEKGEASLEQSMEMYEQGMKITIGLNHKIKDAKLKIEELKSSGE